MSRVRLLSAALAVALVIGLTACGRPSQAVPDTANARTQAESPLTFGSSTATTDTLVYLGDTQGDTVTDRPVFGALLQAAAITPQDLVVLGGDLVNDEQNTREWQAFSAQIPLSVDPAKQVAVVPGNHTPDMPPVDFFARQAPAVVLMAHTEVVLLDSNILGSLDTSQIKQSQDFLRRALALRGRRQLIFVTHHPLFVLDANPKDKARAATMMKNYGSFFKQATLVLCGHEHMYARYTDPATGVTQLIGNASGKGYTPSDPHQQGLACLLQDTVVFTRLSVTAEGLQLTTYDSQAQLIDSATLP